MATTAVAMKGEQRVARPLKVLVPLIQEDLKNGNEAAERAAMPYYQAAGEKMLEARTHFSAHDIAAGKFNAWIKTNFSLGKKQAGYYMAFAKKASIAIPAHTSLTDFIQREINPNYNKPYTVRPPDWHEPVKQIVGRIDTETLNLKRDELKRAEEREAQRKLALQLIDIGYKVLARTLHPDKGGSREAMQRLNAVRDRLKMHA